MSLEILVDKLISSKNETEKKKNSELLSAFLAKDADLSSTGLKHIVKKVFNTTSDFSNLWNSDFFITRIKNYKDNDGKTKVAIGISFLQDYLAPIEEIDEKLLDSLLNEIENHNLELIFNDVTVNFIQVRDGSKASLL
jgi:hypothetical protein